MKKLLAAMLAMVVVTACAPTYKVAPMGSTNQASLSPKAKVYVSVPEKGRYRSTVYHGSGQKTAQIIREEFARHASSVVAGRGPETLEEAFTAAQKREADYLVYPNIIHWEDRATEWSGIPYRAQVKIEVIDVDTKKILQSALIKGKSASMSFGGRPEELLPTPIKRFVDQAY